MTTPIIGSPVAHCLVRNNEKSLSTIRAFTRMVFLSSAVIPPVHTAFQDPDRSTIEPDSKHSTAAKPDGRAAQFSALGVQGNSDVGLRFACKVFRSDRRPHVSYQLVQETKP
jgi:hypothetical protein